ncbi:sulfite reductase subunit alpha [Sinimarinibacterium sp. CAU 1509]|uniref:sulfite reductase subunit alpha n=1 Tax=Sinimarinibacterium sp. CAU 1509 TaxID=2562283 RepID=UPI001B7FB751|nr:sulfite reductase subunit alpha [Sinimarinibacterium sp. CAU 1509]
MRWGPIGLPAVLLGIAALAAVTQPEAWVWDIPDTRRGMAAALVVLLYLGACTAGAWRRRSRNAVVVPAAGIRILHASQTGTAERIALRSADQLRQAGVSTACAALGALDASALETGGTCLFVISTTGEGEPPDNAFAFERGAMRTRPDLSRLHYGLLALGDRGYARYCGFGVELDVWLRDCGARPVFDRIEVDRGDPRALRQWQQALSALGGVPAAADRVSPRYDRWRLQAREHLNPGSVGGAVFRLVLEPEAEAPGWTPGDLVEIRVPVSGETVQRTYSIASTADDGRIELMVRQVRHPNGRTGTGSGWLTEQAPLGADIALRVRENHGFHPPPADVPMILIGNGTGLAGLRAHLRERAQLAAAPCWLLFGERSRRHDFLCRNEIEAWCAGGVLARVDLAFSRDGEPVRYVQDALRAAADTLREWIAGGACLYVCGSLHGMAPGVDAVLREVLGADAVDALRTQGRYRRDVY